MKKLLLILLCFPLLLFSQEEKRLALVIGNANYDKGSLNNPVNDALLMAQTLDSLDFDVILDTNISNKENFIRTIREFGNKRSDYDVAFVYYAGHGIQVGAENFLLPTKVNFETEYDVIDFGVSVQNIMRYLNGMTKQVNILILDACRDNPFEGNWNKRRSLKGEGLAKIPPPTGSLIAFSTDAGNTAADGDGKNSLYCKSLCKNMMLENTSLDQVFRNVRSDVLKITNGNQRPVESSQLTGSVYYLNTIDLNDISYNIDRLILNKKLDSALVLANFLIYRYPKDYIGYVKKGHIDLINFNRVSALSYYEKAIELNSNSAEAYYYTYVYEDDFNYVGLIETKSFMNIDAKKDIEKMIKVDEKNPIFKILLANNYFQPDSPKKDYKKSIDILNELYLNFSSYDFQKYSNKHTSILENSSYSYVADFLSNLAHNYDALGYLDSAIYFAEEALKYENGFSRAYIYNHLGDLSFDNADYEKSKNYYVEACALTKKMPWFYSNLSKCYFKLEDFKNAEEAMSNAIDFSKASQFIEFPYYLERANFYFDSQEYLSSLLDITHAIFLHSQLVTDSQALSDNLKLDELYKFRAKIYAILDDNKLMCNDYKIACDLGDCEMFNEYCK